MTAGLISVHPNELKFIFELRKRFCCDLKVVNNTEHHVAFKVRTTAPKKYCVQPNTCVLQPSDSCIIRFTHLTQKEYPPNMQCKDKFLIQSTIVPSNTNMHDLAADTMRKLFNKERSKVIEEHKFKVFYTFPSAQGNSENEGLKSSANSVSLDVQQLKNERDAAVRLAQQLQKELDIVKRRKQQRNQCGCFCLKTRLSEKKTE